MSVRQLLDSMDSRELSEWQAFFRLEHQMQDEARKDAESKRLGKVTATDPGSMSNLLMAQLAPLKEPTGGA